MTQGSAIIIGVGPGLGLALAHTFAAEGHNIALLARSNDKLEDYATQLATKGVRVHGYPADAADAASLRSALSAAISELGAPDVLIYNAAVLREDNPTDGDDEGWANALAVDVLGAKVAAETVLPVLRDGRGSLLFTGGGFALAPSPQFASVSVGKAALRAYAAVLHAQQQGTKVHVASVTIAGNIGGGEERFTPEAIADAYLGLHRQVPGEWTDELLLD